MYMYMYMYMYILQMKVTFENKIYVFLSPQNNDLLRYLVAKNICITRDFMTNTYVDHLN